MKKRSLSLKADTQPLPPKIDVLSEIAQERAELAILGLTEEDIEGYITFYIENWFPVPLAKGRLS